MGRYSVRCAVWSLFFSLVKLTACVACVSAYEALGQANSAPTSGAVVSEQVTTLKATVRRVGVDVVVTDSSGRAVAGLKQEDFKVEEDKASQTIGSFDVHEAQSGNTAPKSLSLPPNTFLNIPKFSDSGTPVVLLYDILNTSFNNRFFAEQEFFAFLRQRKSDSPIAIFALSDQLYLLQGFTEMRSLPDLQNDLQRLVGALQRNPIENPLDATLLPFNRAMLTLKGLAGVGRFLTPLPGRKSLLWYSSGLPESVLPGQLMVELPRNRYANESKPQIAIDNPFLDPGYLDQIRKAIDLLAASHVAVSPVDVRGILADPSYSAATGGAIGIDTIAHARSRMVVTGRNDSLRATMDAFAEATGGHAFYGTNDLKGAVDQAINDGSTYYSLTYEPTNPKYDGSLRHIRVTLKKPGYNLSYRKTYFADDLDAVARAAADAPESPLSPALERGMPLSHDLFVEAHLDAAGAPVAATPDQMKVLSQFEAMRDRVSETQKKSSAPAPPVMMQPYTISLALIARQLGWAANETGGRQASLEFGVVAYDEEGRRLSGIDTRLDDPLSAERYAKVAADGYRVSQTVAVPVTATCLRLAVRDVKSSRVGSLEVKLPLAQTGDEPAVEAKVKTK